MKVVEELNPPEVWKIQQRCTGKGWHQEHRPCRRLLELEENDILYRPFTEPDGTSSTYYGFVCCECGCFTEIPDYLIPGDVKSFASRYQPKEADKNDYESLS